MAEPAVSAGDGSGQIQRQEVANIVEDCQTRFGSRCVVKKKTSDSAGDLWKIPALDRRPLVVAVAGPNGAGKTTFFESHLKPAGLRFLNADILAGELGMDAYQAADVASKLRQELISQGESFVFETVFSDPAGDLLPTAAEKNYSVVLCFIGIAGADRSEERVAMRVSQGGHDVPTEKLIARYPRTMANLRRAIEDLPLVIIFDNDDLARPYRLVALFQNGNRMFSAGEDPQWLSNTTLHQPD
jgi:predicted ABC-type ATPase